MSKMQYAVSVWNNIKAEDHLIKTVSMDAFEETVGELKDVDRRINTFSYMRDLLEPILLSVAKNTKGYIFDIVYDFEGFVSTVQKNTGYLIGVREMGVDGIEFIRTRFDIPTVYTPKSEYIELFAILVFDDRAELHKKTFQKEND